MMRKTAPNLTHCLEHRRPKVELPYISVREPKQEDALMMDDEGVVELERLEAESTATLQTLTAVPTHEDVM